MLKGYLPEMIQMIEIIIICKIMIIMISVVRFLLPLLPGINENTVFNGAHVWKELSHNKDKTKPRSLW